MVRYMFLGVVLLIVANGCKSTEKIQSLREERDNLHQLVDSLQLEKRQLESDLKALESEDSAASLVANLRIDLKNSKAANSELNRTISSVNDTNTTLNRRITLLEQIVRQKKNELSRLAAEYKKCNDTLTWMVKQSKRGRTYARVGGGHWVQKKIGNGEYIMLEDRSLWEINSIDRIDTMLWLPTEDITVVESSFGFMPYQLINTDSGDKVDASYVGQR